MAPARPRRRRCRGSCLCPGKNHHLFSWVAAVSDCIPGKTGFSFFRAKYSTTHAKMLKKDSAAIRGCGRNQIMCLPRHLPFAGELVDIYSPISAAGSSVSFIPASPNRGTGLPPSVVSATRSSPKAGANSWRMKKLATLRRGVKNSLTQPVQAMGSQANGKSQRRSI